MIRSFCPKASTTWLKKIIWLLVPRVEERNILIKDLGKDHSEYREIDCLQSGN